MRKLFGYITVCLTLGALAPLGFSNAAGASTTRHVHPGESIQHAVNVSAPGDTVIVETGTYAQTVRISTSRITLIGRNATIVPPASPAGFKCLDHGALAFGICVGPTPKNPPLDGVTVQGFTVKNFPASGIFAIKNTNLTLSGNTAIDNGGYGLAAFETVGTRMLDNTASGSHEANFYLGDSPGADALVRANVSHDGALGIFIRNSEGLTVQDNHVRDNCAGILVLADAPGPAGNVAVRHNTVLSNNHACPPAEGPAFSGIGIALLGAHDVMIQSNVIQGNAASGATFASGGVVVTDQGPGSTAPTNNKVTHNVITGNSTDIVDTGSGSGNVYRNNVCGSNPGACR
jgi:parallel beta-helix repeat protein